MITTGAKAQLIAFAAIVVVVYGIVRWRRRSEELSRASEERSAAFMAEMMAATRSRAAPALDAKGAPAGDASALVRQKLLFEAAAKAGGAIPGVNWIPSTTLEAPGVPGRKEVNPIPDHQAGQTDAAKAHDILEQAGKLGFKLTWLYQTDVPQSVAVQKIVSAAYKKAGFDPEPVATTSTDYRAKRADPSTPINIRTGGWLSDWPSGYSWIPPVFLPPDASKSCADQGKWTSFGVVNYAHFCNDDVNQKIKDVEALPVDQQPAAWADLEEEIQTKYYPIIVTDNGGTEQAFGSAIQGYHIDVTGGMPTFKTLWVQQ